MFPRWPAFHFGLSFVAALGGEDDSVNLLQTTVHKQLISQHVGGNKKNCVVKGDPHVKLWDQGDDGGAHLGLYGTYADYWLVKTDALKVMGRIGGVEQFDMGVVKGLAVSGSLMEDKVLIIPTLNNGDVRFDNDPITSFPWTSPGSTVNITIGIGPNFNQFGSVSGMHDRESTYTINMNDKAIIELNQDVFQHLRISADPDVITGDEGLCNHECRDWFNCQNPICNISESLFRVPHPTCGHVIIREKCNRLRLKLAKEACEAEFKDDDTAGPAIQNCIEDCCADRDQCPDRDKGGGQQTCVIFGDPHVKGFDGKAATLQSFSPVGTHFLIKSDHFWVQANYESHDEIKAQIEGIGFTGDLVGDQNPDTGAHPVIYIRSQLQGGGVEINGRLVLDCTGDAADCIPKQKFYKDPAGNHYNITYGPGDDIPSQLKEARPVPTRKHTYTLRFAEGATINVHEGLGHSIYMSIGSRLLAGVSGECGNANGNPDDDEHPPADPANTNCPLAAEIFIPGGKECSAVELPSGCRKKKELAPFRKQCMAHFSLTGSLKKNSWSDRRLVKDCMQDCCLGGECPDGTGDASDEDY